MKVNPKMKFLVIDDMSSMRTFTKKALNRIGFKNVLDAPDGQKAFEIIENAYKVQEPFEFIVSDWNMPNMSGLDLLHKLREDDRFKDLPFLMITAENEVSQVMSAIKAGVDNYIVKPFSPDTLLTKLESVFKKRNMGVE